MAAELYIGLMSGTSVDAIDAALVEFAGGLRLRHTLAVPIDDALRRRVLAITHGDLGADTVDVLGSLDVEIGLRFAEAALKLLAAAGISAAHVAAIGSHGQTVRHRPDATPPFTLQLGDPNVIAARTGITTVADFRRKDLALGGQGAPLMPAFHRAAFGDAGEDVAVVNIGGIANVTLLHADGRTAGFDTGPGNALLDAWALRHLGTPCDRDGAWAASGHVQPELLRAMRADPYFARPAPKSTGREYFNPAWLDTALAACRTAFAPADVQATLAELTAVTIADGVLAALPAAHTVLVCGGGAHNRDLLTRLARHLAPRRLATTQARGIDPDYVEAAGFAWLARETLAGRPGNLPAVTGAARAAVLGAIYPP
ncbi:MAG TPA: anhydro-N-acetylmuramic acid kinase [Gammaproteobacteria bacterium]|nr:anhydro-N-acetylmuramic acid kinase [Gammaproteobacteria bacterium]